MAASQIKGFLIGGFLVAVLCWPGNAPLALGLGEARVDSFLGQRLDVGVRLIDSEIGSLQSLTVEPATARDYDRLGVPSTALALGLDVTVDRQVDPPVIRLRSLREVHDPVVQVLLDARWSSGRLLREYTLFLDPPSLPAALPQARRVEPVADRADQAPAEQVPQPAQASSAPPETPARQPAPAATQPVVSQTEPRQSPADEARPSRDTRTALPELIGPIGSGDTLWSIANRYRPGTGLSVNQIMMALLDRNPSAFIDGNINRLRRGSELVVPDAATMRALDRLEADRRFREQMLAWRQEVAVPEVPVLADQALPAMEEPEPSPIEQLDPEPEPQPETEPQAAHRLEVVPPGSETVETDPAISDTEISEAAQRLADLEGTMYDQGLETDELYRLILDIDRSIESRDRAGLALADERLAELETRLAEAREEKARQAEILAASRSDEQPGDALDDYLRQVEQELGVAESEQAQATDETGPEPVDEAESLTSPTQSAGPGDQVVAQPEAVTADSEPTAGPSGSGMAWWFWLALVVMALVLGYLGVRWWRDRATVDADAKQAGVADPHGDSKELQELSDHLSLLHSLAAIDDEQAFADALDDMYRAVDDEEHPLWQEALSLAMSNAPDHPLLRPRETELFSTLDGTGDAPQRDLDADDLDADDLDADEEPELVQDTGDWSNHSDDVFEELLGDADESEDLVATHGQPDQHRSSDKATDFRSRESEQLSDSDDQVAADDGAQTLSIEDEDLDLAELAGRLDEHEKAEIEQRRDEALSEGSDALDESLFELRELDDDADIEDSIQIEIDEERDAGQGALADLDLSDLPADDRDEEDSVATIAAAESGLEDNRETLVADDAGQPPESSSDEADASDEEDAAETIVAAGQDDVEDLLGVDSPPVGGSKDQPSVGDQNVEDVRETLLADDANDDLDDAMETLASETLQSHRPDEGDASQTLVLGTPLDEEGDEKRAADLDDQPHTDDEFDDGDELEDNDALETIGLAWGEESAADQEEPAAKDSLFDLDDSLAGEEFDLDTLNRLTTEPTGGENQLDAPSSSGSDEGGLRDEDAEVKLDLARAYLSMDDPELARTLLEEIVSGGSVAMRERAQSLLDEI